MYVKCFFPIGPVCFQTFVVTDLLLLSKGKSDLGPWNREQMKEGATLVKRGLFLVVSCCVTKCSGLNTQSLCIMSRGFVGQEFGQGAVGIDCFFSTISVGRLEGWGWSLQGRLVSCLAGNAGFWLGCTYKSRVNIWTRVHAYEGVCVVGRVRACMCVRVCVRVCASECMVEQT